MPANLRPELESFDVAGCKVTVVDGAEVRAASATRRVELYTDPAFAPPIQQVRLWLETTNAPDGAITTLQAEVRGGAGDNRTWSDLGVLGKDPIGSLLARRVEAGDEWASRMVDGVGSAVASVQRRLGLTRDPDADAGEVHRTENRTDAMTGLPVTAVFKDVSGGEAVTLRAEVPAEALGSHHIAAMFGQVLRVIGEARGIEAPAGTRYVLSPRPVAVDADGIEQVTLDQVGGLDDVVAQFQQIAISFQHPQVMARWGARRPQGILLYGPPGTGKTMLARALAHEIGATFREIRTPEILDKWLGASERNIKKIFRDARRYVEPTVLLFDEFDTIISYAGAGDDSASQAINAVAGIFKQEMNNLIEANPRVIVVATTNFPQRVDDSLIRSGRFDVKLAIPAPNKTGRSQILAKMIRERIARHEEPGFRMFADDLDVDALAAAAVGLTGADIKEVLRRVQLDKAMLEARSGTPAPPITQQDLLTAVRHLNGNQDSPAAA